MSVKKIVLLALALALAFGAGFVTGRATKKTSQERFDRAAEEFRKGLLGD